MFSEVVQVIINSVDFTVNYSGIQLYEYFIYIEYRIFDV